MASILCKNSSGTIGYRDENSTSGYYKLQKSGTNIGWHLGQDSGTYLFKDGSNIGWRSKSFAVTVTWNASGGTSSESTRSVIPGSAVGTLPTASYTSYQFDGWWTGPTSGSQVTASTIINDNVIFYARWKANGQAIPIGGFNGGGNGGIANSDTASGGGATHIARVSGLLPTLSALRSSILIVAGAGAGSGCSGTIGGEGGGTQGTIGTDTSYLPVGQPGTQTGGGVGGSNSGSGSFGQGGHTGITQAWPGGGGGAGWFGGGAGSNLSGGGSSGGGGSSYIGNVTNGSTQTGVRAGNGMAKITAPTGTVYTFNYMGMIETFVVPVTGTYTLEVWGAQGGKSGHGQRGGYGGYAKGNITLTAGETLYVVVGGEGVNEANKS